MCLLRVRSTHMEYLQQNIFTCLKGNFNVNVKSKSYYLWTKILFLQGNITKYIFLNKFLNTCSRMLVLVLIDKGKNKFSKFAVNRLQNIKFSVNIVLNKRIRKILIIYIQNIRTKKFLFQNSYFYLNIILQ